jgi:hypothetical protein
MAGSAYLIALTVIHMLVPHYQTANVVTLVNSTD